MQNAPPTRSSTWDPRAALEALFAPKPALVPGTRTSRAADGKPSTHPRSGTKIVAASARGPAASSAEPGRRLLRLLSAEGRAAVTRATRILREHGCELPVTQDVQLQLLEHEDEATVRDAMVALTELLSVEPPRRRALLESRLRRIEDGAEEATTRTMAASLLRSMALGAWRGRA
jgi:hypothetical protein